MGISKKQMNDVDTLAHVIGNTKESVHQMTVDEEYESVEFPEKKFLSLFTATESGEECPTDSPSDLPGDDSRNIDTNSVLDFSAQRRNLVLGIDRKPEIKPLAIFKIDTDIIETMESLPSEINETEIKEHKSEVYDESLNETDDTLEVVMEENVESAIPSISANVFMRGENKKCWENQSKNNSKLRPTTFANNAFVKNETAKFTKNVSAKMSDLSSSVLKRNLIKSCGGKPSFPRSSNQTVSTSQVTPGKASQTKQLISKFDNSKAETGQVTHKPKQVKTPTRLLISKFDNPEEDLSSNRGKNERKNLQFKSDFSNNSFPRPKINPITQTGKSLKNTSKVHQMIFAMNKTGFLQDKL